MPERASFTRLFHVVLLVVCTWFEFVHAQFPRYSDNGLTTIRSPLNPNITISFKSPPYGTCTTVFETQKQYTGYVHLPPNVLSPSQGNYPINTFFWFIEARQLPETAPLTIFINGGPGSSSMVGLFQELGPCSVIELDNQTLGTLAREWGWDRSSNIIFIDQPVQVGFSYDILTNKSLNLLDETLTMPPVDVPITQPLYTFLNGTFGSNDGLATSNTSTIAAQSIWHFLQGFLAAFPQYNPATRPDRNTEGPVGINLFTESYGGKFGPAMASFFSAQNKLREVDPVFQNSTLEVKLVSLGVISGWIDLIVQAPFFPRFAYSNTYGVQAISQVQQLNALSAWNGVGGCQQLTQSCRSQQRAYDPTDGGSVNLVNDACSEAQAYCQNNVVAPYTTSGKSLYDVSQNFLDPFPNSLYLEYLNQADVQHAIGVPVNYTQDSLAVSGAFLETGDYARDGIIQDIVDLLHAGVRVALIYGDRDYACNWLGGEAASYAIAAAAGSSYTAWATAGYAPIVTNNSYIGGVVREYGNLSFSRIYDAGHLVPAYQPETAFTVFSRVIAGTGISLGLPIDLSTFATTGDANATHTNLAPTAAAPICFLRAINSTCNRDQKNMVANRAGVVINGVLYSQSASWQAPEPSVSSAAGRATAPPSSYIASAPPPARSTTSSSGSKSASATSHTQTTSLPTGVFTATGIPTSTVSNIAASSLLAVHWVASSLPSAVIFLSIFGKYIHILA
ncbi:hypothetical protein LTR64_003300 [Lithohypha guttulata]|uniref:uncharacterized protein n=1 Tax=Lithohypha guttulata TaxID=1690604 RepID=UPI002DDFF4F8|nr:hypothetical protein LTR51_000480 [Lithohypha guttulata]